ncbi:MAG: hypothetical protein IPJ65_42465 [Archangiaceae bacterium]|nr:hypothetical protein [Archangiaceae bacterium]
MRALLFALLLGGCSNAGRLDADALARRACTSEGMWCQDASHSRCCRGLSCEDSRCVKREPREKKNDRESL